MIGRYTGFIRTHRHGIGFSFLLMALASPGQTFFISLFGGHLKQAFDLSNGSLGTAYAVGTFASAFTLQRVGAGSTGSGCAATPSESPRCWPSPAP